MHRRSGWGGSSVTLSYCAIALSVLAWFGAIPAQAQMIGQLLRDAPHTAAVPAVNETVLRSRLVQFRLDQIDTLDGNSSGARAELKFFDDAELSVVFDRKVHRSDERYSWLGRIDGEEDGGWFIIAVNAGNAVGNFWTADGRSFELRPVDEQATVYVVHETVQENFPSCATCAAQAVGLRTDPTDPHKQPRPTPLAISSCDDSGAIIDVLVVYTPAARSAAGGTNAMLALIDAAIDASNHAYDNSLIDTQLRLVYADETNYSESGSFSTDLNRLRNPSSGYMDEVHPLRDEYGADMVALIREGGGSCGIAYLMTNLSTGFASSAFSVTRRSCAVGNLTFAHELGHNMGCAHDRDNAGNALFQYSYGHRWTTTSGSLRRSVMAYTPGTRVPHFSNPDVLNGGVPTGIAPPSSQSADNATSINSAAWTVANFRPSVCRPDNDECNAPQLLAVGEHPFTNVNATTDGPNEGTSCNIGSDVWFGHVAQCTGDLTVSLCDSSFNTVLALYDIGCPDAPGQFIACNNNFCSTQSQLTIAVTAGQAVRIRVGGLAGAQGEGVLSIHCEPTTPPCPADLTGSGEVDVSDLLQLLSAWGSCPTCIEDLTGDQAVDVADLLQLLASWGPCD